MAFSATAFSTAAFLAAAFSIHFSTFMILKMVVTTVTIIVVEIIDVSAAVTTSVADAVTIGYGSPLAAVIVTVIGPAVAVTVAVLLEECVDPISSHRLKGENIFFLSYRFHFLFSCRFLFCSCTVFFFICFYFPFSAPFLLIDIVPLLPFSSRSV